MHSKMFSFPRKSNKLLSKYLRLKMKAHEDELAKSCRVRRLDCGLGDLGSIPDLPSPCVGPLMARRLSMSSDVLVPVSGYPWHV